MIFPPPDAVFAHYFDLVYYHLGKEDKVLRLAVSREAVIEEEMKLCRYFVSSHPRSWKLKMHYLYIRAERVYTSESFESKIFIEFVALIIRFGIYTSLIAQMKEEGKRYNYMTDPAAIRELEKIEMIRYASGAYHLDYAITKTQKEILKAFDIDERTIK